jgi:uroporphyrinogen-III synthase
MVNDKIGCKDRSYVVVVLNIWLLRSIWLERQCDRVTFLSSMSVRPLFKAASLYRRAKLFLER